MKEGRVCSTIGRGSSHEGGNRLRGARYTMMKSRRRSGGRVGERGRLGDQPRRRRSAHAPEVVRMTRVTCWKRERADRRDGRFGGRRHGGGDRSISQIPGGCL